MPGGMAWRTLADVEGLLVGDWLAFVIFCRIAFGRKASSWTEWPNRVLLLRSCARW
jgi:hypothetical protein